MEEKDLQERGYAAGAPGEDEIDLVEIFYLLLDRWKQIFVYTVLGGVAALLITMFLITPMYSATSKLYILSASNDSVVNLSDLQIGSQLTKDYQELIVSRPLLEDVISALGMEVTPRQLEKEIKITNTADTRILNLEVVTDNPQLSADIANVLAEKAIKYLPKIMDTSAPNIVETAVVPTAKSSPSLSRNTVLGLLAGFIVSSGFYILRFVMDDTITDPAQMATYFGSEPLGVIPTANLKGKKRKRKEKRYGGHHKKVQRKKRKEAADNG